MAEREAQQRARLERACVGRRGATATTTSIAAATIAIAITSAGRLGALQQLICQRQLPHSAPRALALRLGRGSGAGVIRR